MPQFRKKALITAHQYIPGQPLPEGVMMHGDTAVLMTLEGPHVLRPGDWVARNPKGEQYNIGAAEFAATYEEVTWDASSAMERVRDVHLPQGPWDRKPPTE